MRFRKQVFAGTVGTTLLAMVGNAAATNGDQMIGITATQVSMGGAVLAAPQDAATVMYNPAGLAGLGIEEVRFDSGFGLLNPIRKVNGYDSDSNWYLMPAGAAAFNINDRMYFGMAMGGISGMGVDFSDTNANPGNQAIVTTKQFFKIAPGLAFKVSDALSLGMAFNIGYQSLALSTPQFQFPQNQVYGFGFTVGGIYNIGQNVQLGAAYTSRTNMQDFEWNTTAGKFSMEMDQPEQYGLGAAFKSGGLLIEADVKVIKFSEVLDRVAISTPAGYTCTPAVAPPCGPLTFGWDDQTVYALGVQKDVGENTKVRLGYNYGKSPIGPEDVDSNLGSPAVVEQHFTLGFTRNFSRRASGTLSYMYAPNNEVVSNKVLPGNTQPNRIELEQNQVNFQLSYRY